MSRVKAWIGALEKPVVVAGAPTKGKLPTVVPEVALAKPTAGAFDGAPNMDRFPAGAFHGYPVELVGHDEWLGCDELGEVGWYKSARTDSSKSRRIIPDGTVSAKSRSTSPTGHAWCGCGVP